MKLQNKLKSLLVESIKVYACNNIESIRVGMNQEKTADQKLQYFDTWLNQKVLEGIQNKMQVAKTMVNVQRDQYESKNKARKDKLGEALAARYVEQKKEAGNAHADRLKRLPSFTEQKKKEIK